MKVVIIEASFPELRNDNQRGTGRGEGHDVSAAFSRAVRDMMNNIKCRKTVTEFAATVTIENSSL